MKTIKYKGFDIVNHGGLFEVGFLQEYINLWHSWHPFCDSIKDAKKMIDEILEKA